MVKLTFITAAVIQAIKNIPSHTESPRRIAVTDPRYTFHKFEKFADTYDFNHITSSPLYPQSNGLAEHMVKLVKKLVILTPDTQMVLLTYCATPLPCCGYSPAELLMGRQTLPQITLQLIPKWTYLPEDKKAHMLFKVRQKDTFDNHY